MTGNALAPVPASDDLAELAAAFTDWTIWESDAGRWYATRRQFLAERVRRFGLWATVHAASLDSLAVELRQQGRRATLALSVYGTLT
ncbi:hypothetical protein ACFYTC_48410 [Actinomadura nitritigenes]|jgi:hypothetical protein|uniref:hypothetical protein n=1 Tax=Actinomadura nitritigenes TaxID=134602 RepID=UPI00369BA8B5